MPAHTSNKYPKIYSWLLVLTIGIAAFGLAMLYSASTIESFRNQGNTNYYFFHQLLYGILPGFVLMWLASKFDYHKLDRLSLGLVIVSLVLLVLVKVPGINFSSGGATRWIHFGFITFQPSELAKFSIILYTATWVNKRQKQLKNFNQGVLPYLIILGIFAALILWQPDLGTLLSILLTALGMLYLGGISLKYFSYIIISGFVALAVLIKLEPYRMARLFTFLDPTSDRLGAGYQINQALLAIGSGGLWGYGYGLSRQKHSYLPEVMGDSIFAVIAEEMGFIRVMIFILVYLTFLVCGWIAAAKAPDLFGRMLGFGILLTFTAQMLLNIASIIGIVPLTGLPLPLVSYGSSSLIITFGMLGVLLNIAKQSR